MKYTMKEGGFFTELPYGRLDISGDEAYGIRPYQLMVSSIAVCSGGVLRKILEKQRVDVKDIEVQAGVERNEEEANRIEKVALHFTITGTGLSEKKIEKAMVLTRKNCSMVQSVIGSIEVTETFELKEG
ncbi:OsmC family protein [Falsibacillus albus]|uniref:OsmC family peroxiredoxin n=1 Tax=Falsibacillus albus TaxID=2478915 RepID=A0A3L7JVE1_9BACI|nr:OsmC family protein [Falsibacillus albus]RLQ94500.1 OsmC family peroxiredoxin [Falsibacillus albus]